MLRPVTCLAQRDFITDRMRSVSHNPVHIALLVGGGRAVHRTLISTPWMPAAHALPTTWPWVVSRPQLEAGCVTYQKGSLTDL